LNTLEGPLEHKLLLCHEKNVQILNFLNSSPKLEELAIDYMPNLEVIELHLSKILEECEKHPEKVFIGDVASLDNLYMNSVDLQYRLNQMEKKGTLSRFMNSISLRSTLDIVNSEIYRHFQDFHSSYDVKTVDEILQERATSIPTIERSVSSPVSTTGGGSAAEANSPTSPRSKSAAQSSDSAQSPLKHRRPSKPLLRRSKTKSGEKMDRFEKTFGSYQDAEEKPEEDEEKDAKPKPKVADWKVKPLNMNDLGDLVSMALAKKGELTAGDAPSSDKSPPASPGRVSPGIRHSATELGNTSPRTQPTSPLASRSGNAVPSIVTINALDEDESSSAIDEIRGPADGIVDETNADARLDTQGFFTEASTSEVTGKMSTLRPIITKGNMTLRLRQSQALSKLHQPHSALMRSRMLMNGNSYAHMWNMFIGESVRTREKIRLISCPLYLGGDGVAQSVL
jgi:hypothetical protein